MRTVRQRLEIKVGDLPISAIIAFEVTADHTFCAANVEIDQVLTHVAVPPGF